MWTRENVAVIMILKDDAALMACHSYFESITVTVLVISFLKIKWKIIVIYILVTGITI